MPVLSRRAALKTSAAAGLLSTISCGKPADAPSSASDLADLDAVATAQAIKNRDVTASEVVAAAIDRAERIDPVINAIVTPYFDSAREKAAAGGDGPWFGVPTFIKDLNDVIGQRTGYGSRAFANFIASEQPPLIDRILGSGLISLGKSSSPEFGLTATTEPLSSGATRNPWNTDYSVGGSSGGAGALVAAKVVPVAHASDGGGSIRIPASCCGVFGLKPTRGRIDALRPAEEAPIDLTEPLLESRSVRDTAAFLAMMELDGAFDPVGLVDGPGMTRKKIAFFTDAPSGASVDLEVIAATERVAAKLEELGHEVTEIRAPFDAGVLQDFTVYWGAGAAETVANWEAMTGRQAAYDQFEPWTYGLIDYYESRKAGLNAAVGRLMSFAQNYKAAFAGYDLMVSPVLAAPPPKIGYLATTQAFPLVFERISEYVCFTQYQNVAGAPAASLPLTMSAQGLPIGTQIAALPGNERAILEVAYELEEAMPWKGRSPKLPVQK